MRQSVVKPMEEQMAKNKIKFGTCILGINICRCEQFKRQEYFMRTLKCIHQAVQKMLNEIDTC